MKPPVNNFDKILFFLKSYLSKLKVFLGNAFDYLYPRAKNLSKRGLHYAKIFSVRAYEYSKKAGRRFAKEAREFEFTLNNTVRIIFVSFVVLNIFALYFSFAVFRRQVQPEGEKRIRIAPGMSFDEIASKLESEGVISNAFYFKLAAKLTEKDQQIISRTYIFKNPMNNLQVLDMLTDPSLSFTVRFTIPEGMRLTQIAGLAESKLSLNKSRFLNEAANDSLINALNLKGKVKNLEGFLYPDTYKIPVDISEKELVSLLFNEFAKKVLDRYPDLKRDPKKLLEAVTLASIVQGETQLKDEMPVIAGVYVNRIKKRMKLEADPTVQYALPDGPKKRLMKSDLKVKSPYNTYLNYGLPPGPINNPGIYAVEAALSPEKNEYLFFVATGKGGHAFSKNYQEHLKLVGQYRKNIESK